MTPEFRSKAVIFAGGAGAAAGVGLEVGTGWGTIVGGVLAVAYGLFVMDAGEEATGGKPVQRSPRP